MLPSLQIAINFPRRSFKVISYKEEPYQIERLFSKNKQTNKQTEILLL